jgi:hypothetical protein
MCALTPIELVGCLVFSEQHSLILCTFFILQCPLSSIIW